MLPSLSNNMTILVSGLFTQALMLPPQRSATQMLSPSGCTSTVLEEPHSRPAGILKKPDWVMYGLGKSFTGGMSAWAKARAGIASRARQAVLNRVWLDIGSPLVFVLLMDREIQE